MPYLGTVCASVRLAPAAPAALLRASRHDAARHATERGDRTAAPAPQPRSGQCPGARRSARAAAGRSAAGPQHWTGCRCFCDAIFAARFGQRRIDTAASSLCRPCVRPDCPRCCTARSLADAPATDCEVVEWRRGASHHHLCSTRSVSAACAWALCNTQKLGAVLQLAETMIRDGQHSKAQDLLVT